MKIQKIDINKINPAPYNPRKDLKPGDREYEKLKRSIQEFDIVEPLVWNERSGNLVGGHQRLKILRNELKAKEVEVSVVDLTPQREKALNVALNKISGDWDLDKLRELLVGLDDGTFDVSLSGFDDTELKALIDYDGKEGLTDDDSVPDSAQARVKKGDIWSLGDHRLMCGDSVDPQDVSRLMAGQKSTMIHTDPPYNVNYGSSKNPRHKIRFIENDKMSTSDWDKFCQALYANFKQFNTGDIYMWGAPAPEGMRMRLWLTETGCHWSATIIWKKQQLVLSPANYQRMYEPCFYGWFGKSSFNGDRKQVEVWEVDRPRDSKLHPTMKPVDLCTIPILNSSKPGNIVLDLFGGSGSTLIACEKFNRKCYMIEISPSYCDIIIKRWEEFTGKTAELLKK
jgi:DNA modification methylase